MASVLRLSSALSFPERPRVLSSVVEDTLRRWLALFPDVGGLGARVRLWRVTSLARRYEDWARRADPSVREEIGAKLRRRPRSVRMAARTLALCRAAAEATLNLRPYDVQVRGAAGLLFGDLIEMETGEGKTLTAALAAAAAALSGQSVHVVTVNDYLAKRDAGELEPFFAHLGLRVGLVVHGLKPDERREAYGADVVYVTNKELTFDYLRDQLCRQTWASDACRRLARIAGVPGADTTVMRGLQFAIIDEADSILIDEARTPLIISATSADGVDAAFARQAFEVARSLIKTQDFSVDRVGRSVDLLESGYQATADAPFPESPMAREATRVDLVRKALSAIHLFERDVHYLLAEDKIQIIDEYTGRLMEDRFWNDGLHQMVELKEGIALSDLRRSLGRITYQRFFVRYKRLSGMSGTLRECRRELRDVYGLRVCRIPTHRGSRRRFLPPHVYATEEAKWQAVAAEAAARAAQKRPVLIGTRTVAASRKASEALTALNVDHAVLNAAQDAEEAEVIAEAGRAGRVTVATNMAGRGTDIRLAEDARKNGGLAVFLTERHEAGRIDRQLAGRCGRQGDHGSVHTFLSHEDILLNFYRTDRLGRFRLSAARLHNNVALRLIAAAQRRSERLHHNVRKELLRFEDHLVRALAFAGPPE